MRILFLAPDRGIKLAKHGGHAAGLLRVVSAYVKLGHDVRVLGPEPAAGGATPAPFVPLPRPCELDLLESTAEANRDQDERNRAEATVGAIDHLLANATLEREAVREIEEFRPDLLHELDAPYNATGSALAARFGIPHVLHAHAPFEWEERRFRRPALSRALRLFGSARIRSAKRVVAVSDELKRYLVQDGMDPARIRVVENGVDLDLFRPDGRTRPTAAAGTFTIGFFGSLKEWHGIDVLLAAFERLLGDARFRLLVVGTGPMRKRVRAFAASRPGRVELAGAVPLAEVAEWMRSVDVAVAPYVDLERFYFAPLKVLESMAVGRATIASALGVLPRWIENDATGLLVAPGDARALAAAIRRLADDPVSRERIGAAAAARVRARHSILDRAREMIEWGLDGVAR